MTASIRLRAALAVIHNKKILLVPHYHTDVAPVQWHIPGGAIDFGESLQDAAVREFFEETGLHAQVERIIDVCETIRPEKPWHSVTITYTGHLVGGALTPEVTKYGEKVPQWFSLEQLVHVSYHPASAVRAAFDSYKG